MKKYSAHIFIIALLALPAVAASAPRTIPFDSVDSLVVPADSPIKYSGIETKSGTKVASFRGRFLLTGTYYYGDNDLNDSGNDHPAEYVFLPQAYIVPDDDVVVGLALGLGFTAGDIAFGVLFWLCHRDDFFAAFFQ